MWNVLCVQLYRQSSALTQASLMGTEIRLFYILWHRCWRVCLPVPAGSRVNVAASTLLMRLFECLPKWNKNVKLLTLVILKALISSHSVLQGWVQWRMGPGVTTTTSASTAPTASMEAVSSCVCSSWLLWRMTPRSTTSRCFVGKKKHI